MDRGLIIFVEGETEIELYQQIMHFLRKKNNNKAFIQKKIEIKNLKGIGNFHKKAIGICNSILSKHPNIDFTILLSYDNDVFGAQKKPPINWKDVEKGLKELGISDIRHMKVINSIEDWILKDVDGLFRFLKLPSKTPIKGSTGYDKMCKLFKKSNKVYQKGSKINNFVNTLNIEKITCDNCSPINKLCKELEINCRALN